MKDAEILLSELLDRLNPGLKMKNKWTYILVQHPPNTEIKEDTYIELHELFFDDGGGFIGITEGAVKVVGDDKEDFIRGLKMAIEDAERYPVLTWEEHQLIFNS